MLPRRLSNLRSRAFFFALILAAALAGSGCRAQAPASRSYELKGQILAIDQARQELTVNHADIPGFMPAMTMPYKVRDGSLLKGRTPGELIARIVRPRPTSGLPYPCPLSRIRAVARKQNCR